MINWIVRIKNKNFWLAAIPALLLLVQTVAALFGFTLDLGEIGDKLLAVVNAVFALLVILGVVMMLLSRKIFYSYYLFGISVCL